MKKLLTISAFCTAILSGCATEIYTNPTGPSATFTTPDKSSFSASLFRDSKQCQNEASLSSSAGLSTPAQTTSIPANQLVTLHLHSRGDRRTCDAAVSFTPQANQSYTAISTWHSNGLLDTFSKGTGECTFTILNAKTHQPITVAVRHYQRPTFGTWGCSDNLSGAEGATPMMQVVAVAMIYHG